MVRLLITVLLAVPGLSWAQGGGALDATLRRFERLGQHQARLETRLAEASKRADRLKKQPAGVVRDFQLSKALREVKAQADRLTRLWVQLRTARSGALVALNTAIAAITDDAARKRLVAQRARLRALSSRAPDRIAVPTTIDPLDGPVELSEKADLLSDSQHKVKRKLRRIASRLAHVERRLRLNRHERAAEQSPFVEMRSRRAVPGGGSGSTTGGGAAEAQPNRAGVTADNKAAPPAAGAAPQAPAPPPASPRDNGSFGTGSGGNDGPGLAAPGGGAPAAPSLSSGGAFAGGTGGGLVSVSDLRTIDAVGTRGSLSQRAAALKRAQRDLARLAAELERREARLRRRARSLGRTK